MKSAPFCITLDEFLSAQHSYVARLRRRVWISLALALITVVIARLVPVEIDMVSLSMLNASLVGLVLVAVVMGLNRLRFDGRQEKVFAESTAWEAETVAEWDEDAIGFTSVLGTSRLPWSMFHAYQLSERSLMLFQDSRCFFLVPREAIGEDGLASMFASLERNQVKLRPS